MSFTVTATQGGAIAAGIVLRVKVLTQAAQTQNGATATQSGAAAHQAAIVTTRSGSQVYAALFDVSGTALTANALTTLFDNTNPTSTIQMGTGRSTSATGTPGSETIGASAPADAGLCALAEILPAGTITEDASSPASVTNNGPTSITTAAFTPPAGALLVALVCSNGAAGTVTIALSDSSGLGLTWTEQARVNPASSGYVGIWVAQLPGGATPGGGGGSELITEFILDEL